MRDILSDKVVKTRKICRCSLCGRKIPAGAVGIRKLFCVDVGDTWTWVECQFCQETAKNFDCDNEGYNEGDLEEWLEGLAFEYTCDCPEDKPPFKWESQFKVSWRFDGEFLVFECKRCEKVLHRERAPICENYSELVGG